MENAEFKIKDGVLISKYPKNTEINLEMAKSLVSARLAFQKGVDYPIVIHLNGISSSKEARVYMAKEGIMGIKIGAFIVKSAIEKVIFNFFLAIEKPPIPTKAFTSEADAIKWINEIRNKNPR